MFPVLDSNAQLLLHKIPKRDITTFADFEFAGVVLCIPCLWTRVGKQKDLGERKDSIWSRNLETHLQVVVNGMPNQYSVLQ